MEYFVAKTPKKNEGEKLVWWNVAATLSAENLVMMISNFVFNIKLFIFLIL